MNETPRLLLMLLSLALVSCMTAPSAALRPTSPPPDITAISARYLAMTQVFDARWAQISAELGGQPTLENTRLAYAKAAAAEHELDGVLVQLPLFPTSMKRQWKDLLMANRRLEELYLQGSTVSNTADLQRLEQMIQSAKSTQLVAENALRRDLLLPAVSPAQSL